MAIDTNPAPVNNPPDPQVPVTPTLQDQLNAVAKAQGIDPNAPLTADQQAIKDLYSKPLPVNDKPYSLQDNLNALAAATGTDNAPAPVSSQVDPTATLSAGEIIIPASEVNQLRSVNGKTAALGPAYDDNGFLMPGYSLDENNNPVYVGNDFVEPATAESAQSSRVAAGKLNAQAQQTRSTQAGQIQNGDWRVRLSLASGSQYLYNDPGLTSPAAGILYPLRQTNGVIFPYTPSIQTAYRATYSPYDLTHSNYRGYFYQNSFVDTIQMNTIFTAQDTAEANYLLAVIHFFKSVTKMFYGQDAQRGSPPPMCFLTGLGDYQFNNHPCLVQSFQYNLPADVDYIRAGSPNQVGLNLSSIRDRQSVATNSLFGAAQRLAAAFTTKGALPNQPAPPTLGLNRPTYVPTKIEIALTLLPVQSRQQVSKQFSVKEFANGNLIKKGFW